MKNELQNPQSRIPRLGQPVLDCNSYCRLTPQEGVLTFRSHRKKRKRRTREAPSRRGYRQRYLYNNRCFDHRRRPFDTLQRQNNDGCVQGALTRCAMSAAAHRRRVSRCRGLSLRLTADRRVRNETDLYDLRGTFP